MSCVRRNSVPALIKRETSSFESCIDARPSATGLVKSATRFVVSPSIKTSCFLWIVFAGCLMQSFAETALCTILGGDERAIHLERPLVRIHRESTASKTDTPLFISLALHPAKPSINARFFSYLLTYQEIGTTSNL